MINRQQYQYLAGKAKNRYEAYLESEARKKAERKHSEKNGGPDPYLLRVNKNSKQFTRIVIDSFRQGMIDPALASTLLETPTTKFSNLEAQL